MILICNYFLIQIQQQQHLLQQQDQQMKHQQQLSIEQIMSQQLMAVQQSSYLAGAAAAGVSLPTGGVADTDALIMDKKQREVYVGNLPIGVIDKKMLEELFNQIMSHMVPDPVNAPPVYNVNFDNQGRFGFVEFRTRDLANEAMKMDHLIEISGRQLHINRPKGYEEPTGPPLNLPELSLTPKLTGTGTTNGISYGGLESSQNILLVNCLPVSHMRTKEERDSIRDEISKEASKYGQVEGVVVPSPPENIQDRLPGRAYIRYSTQEDAKKGQKIFHTRTLDDNSIRCVFVTDEEFAAAKDTGAWPSRQHSVAGLDLSGLYNITPLVSGVSGLTVLNTALPAVVQSNSSIPATISASINADEVPYEEGFVKLRGFPQTIGKSDIVNFFKDCSSDLSEADITTVLSADGTPLGEAFVRLSGPTAKLRLALAKDHTPLPSTEVIAEILTAFEEDMQRRMLSGCQLR